MTILKKLGEFFYEFTVEIKIRNDDCEKNVEIKFIPNMETIEILKNNGKTY